MSFNLKGQRVLITGHKGMVGSALTRRLESEDCEILTAGRQEADMTRQNEVEHLIDNLAPDIIIIAAAKVGGILANSQYPQDFLYDNLMIASNLIHAAHKADVNRLLFLGSSCIYPKFAPQPIQESSLLTGSLEPTNEWYAIAKIAGIKLTQAYRAQHKRAYISAMPTNLYGTNDNFDLKGSHVLPALIRKAHEAKVSQADHIEIWGTGTPMREFLHADDCADALIFLLKHYNGAEHVNVGYGKDLTIMELAKIICETVGYKGNILTSPNKPDGTPRKLMSADKLRNLGWTPAISLREGIKQTYQWYLENYDAK